MDNIHEKLDLVKTEVQKAIIGKDEIIDAVLMTVLAGGHILLEDIPGVGKTTLAVAFSKALSLKYRRMQFTPDTLPSDVTGFSMYDKNTGEFSYREGAVMCNLFLGDEINRTSPKTQSALLEVMEEGKVTVDGVTHPLPSPFFVIATQNPLGSVGTQKLPESQLDRFMVRLSIGYPDPASEARMLKSQGYENNAEINPVLSLDEIIEAQKTVAALHTEDCIFDYISAITLKSRNSELLKSGISPRGAKAILRMAKSRAYIKNRDYVVPEDIIDVMGITSSHRITLSTKAKAAALTEEQVITGIAKEVEMPSF
ncbi:MAG: MoxR family ATPase [Clostridia bacterium]|nr:MoxR family ATPase [Clostridia bacterium]